MISAAHTILNGVAAALLARDGDDRWRGFFNLSREGLKPSFYALIATLPFYLICAIAAVKQGGAAPIIPLPAIMIVMTLYALTFPIVAYLLCQMFGRMEIFRPWVIVRNWANLGLVALMTLFMAMSMLGLPYAFAVKLAMLAYVTTLIVDIRLCQTIAELDWIPAIFCACGIAIMGLAMLLAGFSALV